MECVVARRDGNENEGCAEKLCTREVSATLDSVSGAGGAPRFNQPVNSRFRPGRYPVHLSSCHSALDTCLTWHAIFPPRSGTFPERGGGMSSNDESASPTLPPFFLPLGDSIDEAIRIAP